MARAGADYQPFQTNQTTTSTDPYYNACLVSAGQICQLHKRLHQNSDYGHSFIAVQTVFVSGIMLLDCLWTHGDEVWSIRLSNNLRARSSVLFVLGERTAWVRRYRGIVSNDARLDYVGPMRHNVRDAAVLLGVMAGADRVDDRCGAGVPFPGDVPNYERLMEGGVRGLKVGVLREGLPEDIDAGVESKFREAVKVVEKLGATVVEVSVPLHTQARSVYSVVSKMGNHIRMLGKATGRRQAMLPDLFEKKGLPYTPEVVNKMSVMSKEGLLSGEYTWQNYATVYPKAVNIMRKLKDLYDEVLSSVDVIVMPTTLTPANPLPPPDATPVAQMEAAKGMTENTGAFNATLASCARVTDWVRTGQDG